MIDKATGDTYLTEESTFPIKRSWRALPLASWPTGCRSAWIRAQQSGSDGAVSGLGHYAVKTRYEMQKSFGKFLAFQSPLPLDPTSPPETRVDREMIVEYVDLLRLRLRPVSVKEELSRITASMRALAPNLSWGWIRRVPNAPRGEEVGRCRTKAGEPDPSEGGDQKVQPQANSRCKPAKLHIPFALWPESDRLAWQRAKTSSGLFDRNAPLANLAPPSIFKLKISYSTFLAFLRSTERLDAKALPVDRMTPLALNEFIVDLRMRRRASSIIGLLNDLVAVMRALAPSVDWKWIKEAQSAPRRAEAEASRKIINPPDPARVLKIALRQFDHAVAMPTAFCHDVDARNGLILAFSILFTLRLKNLWELEIGKHLLIEEQRAQVTIFDSMKNRTAVTFDVPDWLFPRLVIYLKEIRPRLLGDNPDHHDLWIESRTGGRLSYLGLYRMFPRFGNRKLNRPIHCHLMRHGMADTMILRNLGDSDLIAAALGHTTTQMVETVYTRSANMQMSKLWLNQLRMRRRKLGLEE